MTEQFATLPLTFDNRFINALPADPIYESTRRQVLSACYSFIEPTKVKAPTLVAHSSEVADQIGLSESDCMSASFTNVFSGNELLEGMKPYAQCYGGHQFGNWAGQLGDGRAINLGEVINKDGEHFCLQLKGAGETPYSRTADGLAVLRSSVREFLCSEAMFHLGVPTTRALSLITTGENVVRDMFYDGRPQQEPGAIVCRVAPSFLRFGSYQIFTSRDDLATLKTLVDHTITSEFPHLGEPCVEVYIDWFKEVTERTAEMIAHWMRVGFVHGVMNTDNMSILGLTIDYGPYGWLEDYDPNWTPNTTDATNKRYRFNNQSPIAQWNLLQLANALYPLIEQAEPLRDILSLYINHYNDTIQAMRAKKLGMSQYDEALHQQLHDILQLVETDMTIFFRHLANVDLDSSPQNDEQLIAPLIDAYYQVDQLTDEYKKTLCKWLRAYQLAVNAEGINNEQRKQKMNRVNPKYVLRNYLAQLAIDDAEQGDFKRVNTLLECLRHPYDEQPEMEQFAEKRPEWARVRAGCSMLSCSS
jgi:uncharacterized protein YdiU (UPF0061 family)